MTTIPVSHGLNNTPNLLPDQFFTAQQQQRLAELLNLFRTSRDSGVPIPDAERVELEQLVDLETRAAGQRAAALFTP